jgi:hypothetical protein
MLEIRSVCHLFLGGFVFVDGDAEAFPEVGVGDHGDGGEVGLRVAASM